MVDSMGISPGKIEGLSHPAAGKHGETTKMGISSIWIEPNVEDLGFDQQIGVKPSSR